jgi:hypothetical protein
MAGECGEGCQAAYQVSCEDVCSQMGERAVMDLQALRNWLAGETCAERIQFRYAPSIVVRGEAELFGISSPRFALRGYLPPHGFVNARRLRSFADSASAAYRKSSRVPHLPRKMASKKIDWNELAKEIVESAVCVADSLLHLPQRLHKKGYHALRCELGRAYGEGRRIWGTPFLQHTPLGGGLCAQAACFMVIALHQQTVKSVYGIAELTALARGNAEPYLELGGLDTQSVTELFNLPQIGLQAYHQSIAKAELDDLPREFAKAALRGYLMSQIPLIVPVDAGRMLGDLPEHSPPSVAENNKLPFCPTCKFATVTPGNPPCPVWKARHPYCTKKPGEPCPLKPCKQYHAVVLVGCHTTNQDQYLLNDPLTYPFLEASFDDLCLIRCYHEAVPDEDLPNGPQRPLEFISATPPAIKLPLLNVPLDESHRPGLMISAHAIQTDWRPRPPDFRVPRYASAEYRPGELRLIDFSLSKRQLKARLRPFCPPKAIEPLVNEVGRSLPKRWYWVQYLDFPDHDGQTAASLWLWNAECEPEVDGEAWKRYLVAVFTQTAAADATWTRVFPAVAPPDPDPDPDQDQDPPTSAATKFPAPLTPSLLSSFCTHGASWWKLPLCPYQEQHYEHGPRIPADVYLMMEPEVHRWTRELSYPHQGRLGLTSLRWNLWPPRSAVEFLAKLSPAETAMVAERLAVNFPVATNPIVAFASFLPELARSPSSRQGKLGVAAIRTLIRLAWLLRRKHHHPTEIIELVSGSRIEGLGAAIHREPPRTKAARIKVWLADQCDQLRAVLPKRLRWENAGLPKRYFVGLLSEGRAWSRVLDNLHAALEGWNREQKQIRLALELEPGPYFLLQDWRSVRRFARMLLDEPQIAPWVGFNVDVSHWRLAKIKPHYIDPDDVETDKAVHQRVYHAHISGHHRCAHFGDAGLLDLNSEDDFAPWLERLSKICARSNGPQSAHKFRGYVGMEYEAAKRCHMVQQSFADLAQTVQDLGGQP